MKFVIDEKLCTKYHLTLAQLLLLLSIRADDLAGVLDELTDREAIVNKGSTNKYLITQHWNDIVDEILAGSSGLATDEEWLTGLAKAFAKTFPQGKMPGTAYYYRGNTRELVLRFKKFFAQHPEYKPSDKTKQRIVDAAVRYNLEKDRDPKYRMLAKYFISKNKTVMDESGSAHVEEVSPLADYLENEGQENLSSSDDWLTLQRN